jgi:uncharacterized protein (DUF488 family)
MALTKSVDTKTLEKYCLYTLGYEGKNVEEFMASLREHKIAMLVDVRRNPISRKPGFSKKGLEERCRAEGLEYRHMPELGISSQERKEVRTPEDRAALFRRYKERTLESEQAALESLKKFVLFHKRVALVCFELHPEDCHRSLVSHALQMGPKWPFAILHL